MADIDTLIDLYASKFGNKPDVVEKLSSSGGNRCYYRLSDMERSVIGTVGDSLKDCDCFISLCSSLSNNGVNVPSILNCSEDKLYYLQTDLGSVSLFDLLGTEKWMGLANLTIRELAKLHSIPKEKWINNVGYSPFSKRQIFWDLNYFKYEYLKPLNVAFDEELLEDDFESFSEMLYMPEEDVWGFMMRDCQSRNVMIYDNMPWFIDFQGGRLGPIVYDLVSFLWQAKAGLSGLERAELIDIYVEELCKLKHDISSDVIIKSITKFALFRTLQVLGAYGFRGLVEHRSHFIVSIAGALNNLKHLLNSSIFNNLPELKRVCEYVVSHSPLPEEHDKLRIQVFSFSYKRGYPVNLTGNGGGFIFDCRGMHNPGRYPEYRALTGRDKPVIEFLESKGEVQEFVNRALDLVKPTIDCYLRRDFKDLQIGFGCTGGRHRSVYCAEAFASKIHELYPTIEVQLVHREHDIIQILK